MSDDFPKLLTPKVTAERLHTTTGTLAIWRSTKRYPLPYVKRGRSVFYKEDDVLQFLKDGERLKNDSTA